MPLPCTIDDREYQKFIDCNGQVAVRVVLCDDLTGGAGSGTAFFLETSGTSTPGIPQNLFTFIVPANTRRDLKKFNLSSFGRGFFEIKIDGSLIGSGRVGASNLNAEFIFDPIRPIAAGETLTVDYTAIGNPAQDFEAYLSGFDVTI